MVRVQESISQWLRVPPLFTLHRKALLLPNVVSLCAMRRFFTVPPSTVPNKPW